jgi:xylan 1,4-beta-xylosidase
MSRLSRGSRRWLLAGLLALALPAESRAQGTVDLTVDATTAGVPLRKVWPFYGYDEINNTTTSEGKALLETLVAANTAPVRIRSHFLFNTGDGTPALKWGSTNAYTEDEAGYPVYSWLLTDGIMDAITGAGAFPLVEFGFMPQALSRHPTPYRNAAAITLNGGCFYPPVDLGKWAALIHAFSLHANQRYPNVAKNWLWELWNEPDTGYWHGTFDEYATLYDHTEAALHGVLPDAALGGPAVVYPDGDFLTNFLQHCADGTNAVTGGTGTRLDLVTFHAKGGVALTEGQVRMDLGNQLRLHRAGFRAVAAFPRFKQTPIHITEADPDGCAACLDGDSSLYDYRHSTVYGAYEVAMMKHSLDLAVEEGVTLDGVLTWAFTFPGTPYFAGYRVLASNGIALPVLGAFKLLGRLDGARLPLASTGARGHADILANGVRGNPDVDGLAAMDGDIVRILMWNYHDDLVAAAPTPVRLTLTLPPRFGPRVRVAHLRVDESHGDAYAVWNAQGRPASPSVEQLAALRLAMEPAPLVPEQALAVTDGAVDLTFDLPRFGVSLITVEPTTGDAPPQASSSGCACALGGRGTRTPDTGLPVMAALLWLFFASQRRCRYLASDRSAAPPREPCRSRTIFHGASSSEERSRSTQRARAAKPRCTEGGWSEVYEGDDSGLGKVRK